MGDAVDPETNRNAVVSTTIKEIELGAESLERQILRTMESLLLEQRRTNTYLSLMLGEVVQDKDVNR